MRSSMPVSSTTPRGEETSRVGRSGSLSGKPASKSDTYGRSVRKVRTIATEWTDVDQERLYDLTPLGHVSVLGEKTTPRMTIDPWEAAFADQARQAAEKNATAPDDSENIETQAALVPVEQENSPPKDAVFIEPNEIHPNMEHKQDEIEQLRLLAGKLNADFRAMAAPALARRIRDFQFAQEKRRQKYGDERPWGILGLYDHLSSIRIDMEWAEDANTRRLNGEPYLSWAEFDENKRSGYNRPFFTYFLLFVCTAMLIASIAVNGWTVQPLDENAMIGPSAQTLIIMGAKDSTLIVHENEGWRLMTSTVLHAGLVHYFINMLALWFVGGAIETSHGRVAAMIIFAISAIGGAILSAIFLPEYITVGASGGIFGFVGACLADIIMNWKTLFCDFVTENAKKQSHIMVVVVLVLDILLNALIGLTPYVDNFTHLGGMCYGFCVGLSTMQRLSLDFFGMDESWYSRAKHFVVRFAGIILSLVSIVVTLIVLLQGDGETTPCPSCTWLSCVPFPPWGPPNEKWWYCDACGTVSADLMTQPNYHLEIDCPDGESVTVDLSSEGDVSRSELKKRLPSYCRQYCLGNNTDLN